MSEAMINLLFTALGDTLIMVFASALFGYLLGLPLGIALYVTKAGQTLASPRLNNTLGFIVNMGRSAPFIILLVAITPLTRLITGTSIGTIAVIVPLTIGAVPFIARLVEGALIEVPDGLLEAAKAMGAKPLQITTKVLLPEALPGILNSVTITLVTLVNFSAMAGVIGGGGLGDVAIRYGYQRYDPVIMWVTVAILVVLVQLIQSAGERLVNKCDHR
ncbi:MULTISPECIES: methionine ABC transporter permease [Aeromonas]|uniref:methionine ABC transporter permease n=1 Tax=Aeromonas TaxID=642 RepID=UPI000CDE533F|nr:MULTISPECIES: methionine ABC transporter permease [Aeromonas]AUZ76441.1 methionine ABC transporter permease [Aeromonas sp. ASNIH4]POU32256.1 methionine ABC transporter permease [Aeromonas hydrophila]POV85758.1 methionine ABC transporter permease [Aeromonas sp. ASNIH6]